MMITNKARVTYPHLLSDTIATKMILGVDDELFNSAPTALMRFVDMNPTLSGNNTLILGKWNVFGVLESDGA